VLSLKIVNCASTPVVGVQQLVKLINILLEAEEGVIERVSVLPPRVKVDGEDIVLEVESVAVTTCNTLPPPALAKVLSPLRNVVASLVPVADKSSNVIVPSAILPVKTALSAILC
jgi:hypothetical protein